MSDRILIIIFDGIGDRPVEKFDGKTPLEKADTPNLDSMAKKGINGIMDTISPGVVPGSDTGHLALLGYDPYEVYTGRGPFEAAGLGLEVSPTDVAFRCNFGTVDGDTIVDRRAGRIKEKTSKLAEIINDIDLGIDFQFKEGVEHRGVLVFREENLGSEVTDVDPHKPDSPYKRSEPIKDTKENRKTAELLNEFTEKTREVLGDHEINKNRKNEGKKPANIILPRGAGTGPQIEPLSKKNNLDAAAIAGIPLVRGVCRSAGMDIIDVEGATGGMDTDIEDIMKGAKDALKDHEFVLVNIKGPDLSGHDGKPAQKKEFIEKLDKASGSLKDIENTYCAFTGDHSTPVSVMDHSGDPLPLTICGDGVRKDDVEKFGERSCAKGDLNRINGGDLFNILIDLAQRAEKFGA